MEFTKSPKFATTTNATSSLPNIFNTFLYISILQIFFKLLFLLDTTEHRIYYGKLR